jgi:predicted PhzF superfamily epimerase YddE/YHI9
MSIPISVVDAFTAQAFAGNPAAVCLLTGEAEPAWMSRVAGEMNLAETAFVAPRDDGFGLRWFTPSVEVDLCGHATLAAAHVLWETDRLPAGERARFHTQSGLLTASRAGDWIELDFPATPDEPVVLPAVLQAALGVLPKYVGRSRFDYLAELDDEAAVRGVQPDFGLLKTLKVRGVIVTAASDDGVFDFVSRFFAPAAGIDEDPVTGSAHCCLAPFWQRRLGKTELLARQVSARGGVLKLRLEGDRVRISGQAVTVWRGELLA